jgi:hypothetical protein
MSGTSILMIRPLRPKQFGIRTVLASPRRISARGNLADEIGWQWAHMLPK